MKLRWLTLTLLFIIPIAPAPAGEATPVFREVAVVAHPPLDEMSGIVRSRTLKDVYWVHNDSGDEPRLFALDGRGRPLLPPWLEGRFAAGPVEKGGGKTPWPGLRLLLAANLDWEDIALDGDTIYIADTGNNGNARRDLGVYKLKEPNPLATERMRVLAHFPIRYPDQKTFPATNWDYDCESLFVFEGKLYFLTKHRPYGSLTRPKMGSRLYRMDTWETANENVLTLVEERKDLLWPMAADLSSDSSKLAVLCLNALWVFDRPAKGDRWLSGRARRAMIPPPIVMSQAEGVTWDDEATLRISSESRRIYTVKLDRLADVK